MSSIDQNIGLIIDELVNPTYKLSEILFKVKLLAIQLQNDEMKSWIEKEINGYEDNDNVPSYRNVFCNLTCTLIKDNGFDRFERVENYSIPLDILSKEAQKFISDRPLFNSVADLEYATDKGQRMYFQYPIELISVIQSKMESNVVVQMVQLSVEANLGVSILNKLRSKLLDFIMKLKDSEVDLKNYTMKKNNKNLNKIIDQSLSDINANNLSISIGNGNNQLTNFGSGTQNNSFLNKSEDKFELLELLGEIRESLVNLSLSQEDKEDISDEITRVEKQLKRDTPKTNIINTGLQTIHTILTSVVANAYTPVILEKLNLFMNAF